MDLQKIQARLRSPPVMPAPLRGLLVILAAPEILQINDC